jgi:hypothetical protein
VAVLTLQFRRFTEEHLNAIMNKKLVRANDNNNMKAIITLVAFLRTYYQEVNMAKLM